MIKLERNITPLRLTPGFIKNQTDEFKKNSSNVWNLEWLKECLLQLSFGKCAYCECSLQQESNYMEVEHFQDKDTYPDKVLEWENLLPACKKCNWAKGTHDVITTPIINPFIDLPHNHIYFWLYRIKGKDTKWSNTIDVVNLNHPERAIQKRFEVGDWLIKLIESAQERLDLYKVSNTSQRKNKLLNMIEGILKECQPSSIYSATCATILHLDPTYTAIKEELIALGIWNSELEYLHKNSIQLILN